jgi:hypothetical protein
LPSYELSVRFVLIEIFSGRIGNYPTDCRITPFDVHGSRFAFMMRVSTLSWINSDGSATAGIRGKSVHQSMQQTLKISFIKLEHKTHI